MSAQTPVLLRLQDWLEKLERLNPNRIELGLDRARSVLERMQLALNGRILIVGGTNGKGTSVALLNHFLSLQGFSVGAYTSPHLIDFSERINIRGVSATQSQLVEAFEAVEAARGSIHLTYFEFTTLAAAYLFSQSTLDFWLLEVGLGGRLDAVNLFDAEVAAVTNIGLDHQDWLGDTLEQIGAEKAGIYREGRPAIFGSSSRPASIDTLVAEKNAKSVFAGRDFGIRQGVFWWGDPDQFGLSVPESQYYTPETLATVLAVLSEIQLMPSEQELESLKNFGLPGRFQCIATPSFRLIADVAHNGDAVALLANRLMAKNCSKLQAVAGFMQDKLMPEIVQPLTELVDQWILVRPSTPRAASFDAMEQLLADVGVSLDSVLRCPDMASLGASLRTTNTAVIYGSFYTVGESLTALGVEFG